MHPPRKACSRFDAFGPGGLSGPSSRKLAKLPTDAVALAEILKTTRQLTLYRIRGLIGEALVPQPLRRALHQVASELPGAEVLDSCTDQLGRKGHGIARIEEMHRKQNGWRLELTFDPDSVELLGYRHVLLHDEAGFAPAGAVVGWTSYLTREIVDTLPPEAPAPAPRR